MPRLSLRVTSHSPPSCGIALSLFSSQSAGCAHCIHCNSLSLSLSPQTGATILTAHTLKMHLNIHTNIWAANSSLWLTSCGSPSLTLQLFFRRFWVRCPHTCCKVCEPLPYPSFWRLTIWWISARLRQGVRHGRIRYKLSLLQGTASRHGFCLHLFVPHHSTTSSFSSPMFFNVNSQFFPSVHKTSLRICVNVVTLMCLTLFPFLQMLDWKSRLWANTQTLLYVQVFFVRMLTYVCLSFPHATPLWNSL